MDKCQLYTPKRISRDNVKFQRIEGTQFHIPIIPLICPSGCQCCNQGNGPQCISRHIPCPFGIGNVGPCKSL